MQKAHSLRFAGLLLAAAMTIAATAGATAQYMASQPGADLAPVGNAENLVSILQANQKILWTSTSGPVGYVTANGWPTSDGDFDLGGAMTIIKPENPQGGLVDMGEKPMSVSFELAG